MRLRSHSFPKQAPAPQRDWRPALGRRCHAKALRWRFFPLSYDLIRALSLGGSRPRRLANLTRGFSLRRRSRRSYLPLLLWGVRPDLAPLRRGFSLPILARAGNTWQRSSAARRQRTRTPGPGVAHKPPRGLLLVCGARPQRPLTTWIKMKRLARRCGERRRRIGGGEPRALLRAAAYLRGRLF